MVVFADNLLSTSVVNLLAPEPHIHADEDDSLLSDKKNPNVLTEQHLNVASQTVSGQSYSARGEGNTGTPSYTERNIFISIILSCLKGLVVYHVSCSLWYLIPASSVHMLS